VLASIEMDGSDEPLHPAIRALKTICRCNNIKYRTIERAIREGARTLHQIASRTTATTGHCGGSCTPDVQEMLAEHCQAPCEIRPAAADPNAWWIRKP
jgi:NAD(P)H-nitrite reductase large subunit